MAFVCKVKKMDDTDPQTWPSPHWPTMDLTDRMDFVPNVTEYRRNNQFMAAIKAGLEGRTEVFRIHYKKMSVADYKSMFMDYLTSYLAFKFSPDDGVTWLNVHVKSGQLPENLHGPWVALSFVLEVTL